MTNRKTLTEIGVIILGAAIIGFAYNYLSPKGISLIPKDSAASMASDSSLFSPIAKKDSAIAKNVNSDTAKVITENKVVSKNEPVETKQNTNEKKATTEATGTVKPIESKPVEKTSETSKPQEIKTINLEQMKKIAANSEGFIIIDARRAEEFAKGKIGNAINIFPDEERQQEYMGKVYALPRDKKYVIYCTGGNCELSHHVAEAMKNGAYKNIFIFTGGWEEWTKGK